MKASLIIPAWNAEKTIEDCILSAIDADKCPDEILIVDDNADIRNIINESNYNKIPFIISLFIGSLIS